MARATATAPFLTEVWREACQHIELAESAVRIFPHLAGALPVAQILVRELDLSRHAIETIAAAPAERETSPARDELRADELDAILAWSRSGALERSASGALRRRLPGLLPRGSDEPLPHPGCPPPR